MPGTEGRASGPGTLTVVLRTGAVKDAVMIKSLLYCVLMLAMIATPVAAFNPTASQQRKAAHQIVFTVHEKDSETGEDVSGRALCTANAIGSHALLTANHCDMGETELRVDNELIDRQILGRIADGEDHLIFLVGGSKFKDTMGRFYSPDTYQMDKTGDEVFMYGDGGKLFPPQYRKGYRMDYVVPPADEAEPGMPTDQVYLFDMNIIGGDSGSAIYSKKSGNLVSLVTYSIDEKFCGAYIMKFTQAQIEQAENF